MNYLLRRVAAAIPTYIGITLVTFAVVHLAPGDAAQLAVDDPAGGTVSAGEYERLREYFGLDRPLVTQYLHWLWAAVRLDFGHSFADGQRVIAKIGRALPPTVGVSLVALLLSLLLAVPLGIGAARRRAGLFDTGVGAALYALYSVPPYVLAMLLILVVGVRWDLLPFRGMTADGFAALSLGGKIVDVVRHALLITICVTVPLLAYMSRFVRGNVLEQLGRSYIRTARAKGAPESRVFRVHAFRNTWVQMITLAGLLLPTIVSGSVILEVIFSWPGIGRLIFEAMLQRDVPTIMGMTVISALLVLVGTLLADLACAWADPRIRHE